MSLLELQNQPGYLFYNVNFLQLFINSAFLKATTKDMLFRSKELWGTYATLLPVNCRDRVQVLHTKIHKSFEG